MELESVPRIEKLWSDEEARAKTKRYPENFPPLPPLAAGRYTREDFFALEKANLWRKTWLFVGLADELQSPGSFKTLEIADVPIIIVRGEDQVIRAFHNTCQHRGAMLVPQAEGCAKAFSCRYHCWTYDLYGTLRHVPDQHDFAGLDCSKKSLQALRCELHGNLVFISQDPQAKPLHEFLGALNHMLGDVPWDRVRLYKVFEWDVDCNWKCIHDAFSETYHVKYIHRNSVNAAINQAYTARHMLGNGHNAMVVKNRAASGADFANVFDRRAMDKLKPTDGSGLYAITGQAQRSYNIFPNLTVPIAENLFTVLSVWPLAVDKCRVRLHYIKHPSQSPLDTESDRQTVEFFNAVLLEDFGAVKGMNASLAGGGITEIPLCYGEQFIYNFHKELDRTIGRSAIPPELRVHEVELPLVN